MKTQLQNMRLLPAIAVNSPNITVLKFFPIVLALGLCLSSFQLAFAQLTFIGGTGAIPDDECPTNTSFTATSTAVGTFGTDINDVYLELDISHAWTADLKIRLLSPGGGILDLASGVGGAGDNFTGTVFRDGGNNITSASAPFTGVYKPQGGTFASAFSGEASNGVWTLLICDDEGLYYGTLNSWSMTFDIGSDPVISCTNDITVNNTSCYPTISYSPPSASDTEDGTLTPTRTRGPATGSTFPAGDTVVEFSVTDSDGNTSTCQFTVTVHVTIPPLINNRHTTSHTP
ncbi:proprotein convertase P-domain-containing protein [Winogradskyella sp.]|uniref:proprotein convertase P-domain-containing protein n=1 Tax=Winogradskyella sp. TaxID=1883156 RepID=UPI003BAD9870